MEYKLKLEDWEVETLLNSLRVAAANHSMQCILAMDKRDHDRYNEEHEQKMLTWQLFDYLNHSIKRQKNGNKD